MADVETLAERVRTVERAVTDGASEFPEATALADLETRIETIENRVEELDDRTTELDAATQALRGYVGNIKSVNDDVEQRAEAALAATDRLEARLDDDPTEEAALSSRGVSATGGQQDPPSVATPHRQPAPSSRLESDSVTGTESPDPSERPSGFEADGADEDLREIAGSPQGPSRPESTDTGSERTESGIFARIRAYL